LFFDRTKEIPYQKEIQDIISQHDELIVVFPIRWIDSPAILKNFFDINMSK
jgi:putative NADPH-quinone reductase